MVGASARFLSLVPHEYARRHLLLGREAQGGAVAIAHAPGTGTLAVHNACVRCGAGTVVVEAVEEAETLARQIDAAYADAENPLEPGQKENDVPAEERAVPVDEVVREALSAGESDLLSLDGKGPVVRLVDAIVFEAIGRGASDIHVQSVGDRTLVRYRLDGVLVTVRELPLRLGAPLVSRVKVMARMDVAERRAPQDGRTTVTIGRGGGRTGRSVGGRAVDLRLSTIPSTYGERLVIRLLDADREHSLTTLEAVGMPEHVRVPFLDRAGRSSGIVLVTGPTGSGKTTTLYATLRWICSRSASGGQHKADVNVMTIEDPVEYDLSGAGGDGADEAPMPISQTQVDPKKDLTFATGLRHILRQDPDVIMVGEIRDQDTARIAIQASLTGHLVFSTLHTSDAVGAVTRLLDLGVEPFLVASSLSAVLAQRLVRCMHAACRAEGCPECLHTGYRGRTGMFELLVVDAATRGLIGARADEPRIRSAAEAAGLRSLEAEGRRLIHAGITTEAEVRRVCQGAG